MTMVVSVKTDVFRMAATLHDMSRQQFPFAVAGALNDAARTSASTIDADIAAGRIFSKATPFTRNAVVAPPSLGARKNDLTAVVTVRPLQSQYLLHEQIGGTRTPAENTRKPAAQALVMPGRILKLNAYSNIPNGTLRRLLSSLTTAASGETADRHAAKVADGKRVRDVATRDRGVFYVGPAGFGKLTGGIYQRLPGHRIGKLISFRPSTNYRPRFDFSNRVARVARDTFMAKIGPRLAAAVASAKPR